MGGGSNGRVTSPSGKPRAVETAQIFEINWEDVTHLSESVGITTGASAEEAEAALKKAEIKKPFMVLVCDEFADCPLTDILNEKVLTDENVGLGARAFRTVRMKPEDTEREALLEGLGTKTPRLILIDPIRKRTIVLEGKSKFSAKTLYSSMRKIADKFYDAKLSKVVKQSLTLLAKVDKIAPEAFKLREKKAKLDEDAPASKVDKIRDQLAKLDKEKAELLASERELWKLPIATKS